MNKFDKALLNGAGVRDLVGMAMGELWVDFEYDAEDHKLVCDSEERLTEHRTNAERKLEALKGMTPEEYRDELLIRCQGKVDAIEDELREKSAVYERAMEAETELENIDISDGLVSSAARKLRTVLRSTVSYMEVEVFRLKTELDIAKRRMSELTEWSQETREKVERRLAGELRDAELGAQGESGFAQRLQANMRAAEAFDEIFGSAPAKECEEDLDRE